MSVIDVAEMRSEPEVSLAHEPLLPAALSLNAFPLHKQTHSVGKRQVVISGRLFKLTLKSLGHGSEAKFPKTGQCQ